MSTKSDESLSIDERYYKSINELPLENWIECTAGKLEFCRKINKQGNEKKDVLYWDMIYDDYIKKQGLSKMLIKLLDTMVLKAKAELEFCLTKDRFVLTQAEMHETKLEQMLQNNGSGMTIAQTLVHLSKWVGSWVNTKTITTKEYFDLLGEFEKSTKINNNGKKNK